MEMDLAEVVEALGAPILGLDSAWGGHRVIGGWGSSASSVDSGDLRPTKNTHVTLRHRKAHQGVEVDTHSGLPQDGLRGKEDLGGGLANDYDRKELERTRGTIHDG